MMVWLFESLKERFLLGSNYSYKDIERSRRTCNCDDRKTQLGLTKSFYLQYEISYRRN